MRRRTKKILFIGLTIILLVSAINFLVNCDFNEDSFKYTINDGKITLTEYVGDKEYVLVPSKIDGMKVHSLYQTFSKNNNVKKVYIQPGVSVIDEKSFFECENLKTVYIPDTVWYLGTKAFAFSGIQRINISQVTNVGTSCFYGCKDLYYFVSETKESLHLGHLSFFHSGLTYMFLEDTPQYYSAFSQTCTFGTNQGVVSKVVFLIPIFSQLIDLLRNYQVYEWLFVLLVCGYLLAFLSVGLIKINEILSGILNKNSYKKYLAQNSEIINKTQIKIGTNNLAHYKNINRISSRAHTIFLISISLPYAYVAFLLWYELFSIDYFTLLVRVLMFILIGLAPFIVAMIFKFIRLIYRTIKVRRFDKAVKPKLRIIKQNKKRRYKYGK